MSEKYDDEWQWWERYLNDIVIPWVRRDEGKLSFYFFELIGPNEEPWDGTVRDAVRIFRDRVKRYYHGASYQMDLSKDWGRILDIGCGPLIPTADFKGLVFGVDPNIEAYRKVGYPVDSYGVVLVPFAAEDLWMLPSGVFDTVMSHNALNHVDDFEKTVAEMERLAKPDSFWRFETEYRIEPTLAEPHMLDDERVLAAFKRFKPRKVVEHHWEGIRASVMWEVP